MTGAVKKWFKTLTGATDEQPDELQPTPPTTTRNLFDMAVETPPPLLQGVHVEPIMAFGEAIRFNLSMRFITVQGERDIFLGSSTDGGAMNTLADDIRRELGMLS